MTTGVKFLPGPNLSGFAWLAAIPSLLTPGSVCHKVVILTFPQLSWKSKFNECLKTKCNYLLALKQVLFQSRKQ